MTNLVPNHIVSDGYNTTGNVTVQITHCEAGGSGGSFLVGVAMGVLGSVLINIGQNLQSSAMQGRPDVQAKPCTSRTWVTGLSIFISGSLLNFLAFTFASASILVPIEAVQFVVNVIYGKYVNKKDISSRMLVGVALTITGTVLCVTFGSSDTRCFTLGEMINFWTQPLWWIYLAVSFGVAFFALSVYLRYKRAAADGRALRNSHYVLPVAFAVSSALLGGGQMIVHSKAIAELFELQVQMIEPLPVTSWYFYLEFGLLATGGAFWLYKMNEGIGLFDPLFIIPLLQSCYILFGVIAGGIYFEEFAGLHNGPAGWLGWPLFVLGMGGVLGGLYLIAPQPEAEGAGGGRKVGDVGIGSGGLSTSSAHARRERVHSVDMQEVALQVYPSVEATQVPPPQELPHAQEPTGAGRHSRTPSTSSQKGRHSRTPSSTVPPAEISVQLEEDGSMRARVVDDEGYSDDSAHGGAPGPDVASLASQDRRRTRSSGGLRPPSKADVHDVAEAAPLSPRDRT